MEVLSQALRELRTSSGGPGSRTYLANVGQQLKRRGLEPQRDLGMKLGDLLRQMPSFCRVEGRELLFLDGEPDTSALRSRPRVIRRDLWDALVSDPIGAEHYLDLTDQQIREVPLVDGSPGDPVAAEPYRFLRVPRLTTAVQLAWATAWLNARIGADDAQSIVAADRDWMHAARERLSEDLFQALRQARREWVLEHALRWLGAHDLMVDRFITTVQPERRQAPPAQGPASDRLRDRLHEIIDAMTPAELEQLRVPARFLVE